MPLNDLDDFSGEVLDESTRPTIIDIGRDGVSNGYEIGAHDMNPTPFESVMMEPIRIGNTEIGEQSDGYEIGNTEIGNVEIGALRAVIKQARDNRRPAPSMRAVSVDEPARSLDEEWGLQDVCIGEAIASGGANLYPLLSEFLNRFGAGGEPRYVRVDTEESYKAFRAQNSPEMSELQQRVQDLANRLEAHESDPHAHDGAAVEEWESLTELGAAATVAEKAKTLDLGLPKHFGGKVHAWQEGDMVCASIALPGRDGEVRICTAMEPASKGIEEMARHASEAGVPASVVVGYLPAMGCVLGAANAVKDMAKAAPAILNRPEAASKGPFVVRIEPKANPALCALIALSHEASTGNQRAMDEWNRIGAACPPAVKQMMGEAVQIMKSARIAA